MYMEISALFPDGFDIYHSWLQDIRNHKIQYVVQGMNMQHHDETM